jgi:hypothetical protein
MRRLDVEAPAWQGARAKAYWPYVEPEQRSQAGCIGGQAVQIISERALRPRTQGLWAAWAAAPPHPLLPAQPLRRLPLAAPSTKKPETRRPG